MSTYKRPTADGSSWYYRVVVRMPDGSRVRVSGAPTINSKLEAERAERAHVERTLNPPAAPVKAAPTFKAFAEDFMSTHAAAHNKPSERKSKRYILDRHLYPTLADLRLDAIGRREIDAIQAALTERGLARKTTNNALAVLSKILRYAVETGDLRAKPRMGMLKVGAQPFRFLDFEAYEALTRANAPDREALAAILLAGDAGLRLGELRGLQIADCSHQTNRITVRRSFWEDELGTPKSGKPRTVPMTKRLAAALKATKHLRGPWLLAREDGGAATKESMRWLCARLWRRAGMDDMGWHSLRHTFCSHLAMRGAPARTIQELAGHEDLATTLKYMHLTPGATDAAIALLEQPWHVGGTERVLK